MSGSFDFMREKFPEISDDGQKAENYLFTDNAACVFYISRVFDNILKTLCTLNNINLKSEGKDRNLSDLIDELKQKKIISGKILRILHNMRMFRNKNAHNEDTSEKDSIELLKQARVLCKWLMKSYGGNASESKESNDRSHINISITDLMNEYERDKTSAGRKYEGRQMTITGGHVLKVKRSAYGEDAFIVILMSKPEDKSAVMSTVHKVDCYFPLRLEERLSTLTPGKNFTATGTWQNGKLKNCTWKTEGKRRNIFFSRRRDGEKHSVRKWRFKEKLLFAWLIICLILVILALLGRH